MIKFLKGYLLLTALIVGVVVVFVGKEPLKKGADVTVSEALVQVAKIVVYHAKLKFVAVFHHEKEHKEKQAAVAKKQEIVSPPKTDRKITQKHRTNRALEKKRVGFTATFITNYMKSHHNEVVDEDAFQRTDIIVPDSDVKKEQTRNSNGEI